MPRRKNVIAPEAQTMDLVAKEKDENLSVANQILSKLGVLGTEYNSFFYAQTAKYLSELHEGTGIAFGAVLLSIKEHEPHGNFQNVLKQIGTQPRKAQFYMRYAKRYGKYENFSHLSNSKLDLFEAFSDEELKKLDAGEEVKGLTLDAIDRMPASEAREKLRSANGKIERLKDSHKKEVEKLNDIISDLKIRAEDPMQLSAEQKAARELRALTGVYSMALSKISAGFREAMSILDEGEKIPGIGVQELNAWLNEFVPDSATINNLFSQWQAGFDDPSPIVDNFKDIIEGKVNV